jgi:hypothetical protein
MGSGSLIATRMAWRGDERQEAAPSQRGKSSGRLAKKKKKKEEDYHCSLSSAHDRPKVSK